MRIEQEGGHRFVPDVVEAFPGEIQAISVSKPALEDVFIHRTGHKFWSEDIEPSPIQTRKSRKRKRGGSLRPMILVLSLVLGIVPLVGVVWIFVSGMITLSPFSATVDGLFMTLILLTLSACFLLNAFWEMRDRVMGKKKEAPRREDTRGESELTNGNPSNNFDAADGRRHQRD